MNPINIALVIEQIKQFNVKIQSRRILVIFTSSWGGFYPMKSCFTVSIISYLPRVTYYMCLDYHTILWFLYYIYWLYCIFYSYLRLKFSHGRTHVLSTKTSSSLPKIAEKKKKVSRAINCWLEWNCPYWPTKGIFRAIEMAQQVKLLASKPNGLSLISGICMVNGENRFFKLDSDYQAHVIVGSLPTPDTNKYIDK